jgi:hypothetical protein
MRRLIRTDLGLLLLCIQEPAISGGRENKDAPNQGVNVAAMNIDIVKGSNMMEVQIGEGSRGGEDQGKTHGPRNNRRRGRSGIS